MRGLSDAEQLAFASQQGRVMVTMDSDFIALAVEGQSHAGIVFITPRASISEAVSGLLLIHDVLMPDDMMNHVEYI